MNLPWNILVRNSHQTGENYNLTPVKSAAADEDTSQLFWQLKNGVKAAECSKNKLSAPPLKREEAVLSASILAK